MITCPACGHHNAADANFCSNCGSKLEQAPGAEVTSTITFTAPTTGDERSLDEADAAAVDALPLGSALLIVQRGPGAGSRFLLDSDVVTAGRHPDSEIFLDDVTVSRRHAEFRRSADGYTVTDIGSLNGTYVNRDRIDEVLLQGGDEVQIGKFRLVYFARPSGSASGPLSGPPSGPLSGE